jgi:energy-coupling factor transport system substrate-specific component
MNNVRWRTVDIIVTAIIAVAFGIVFWAWNSLWFGPFQAAFAGFPPAAAVINGVWFVPAVLAPLIVRKPGAGLFAELVAAIISALIGSAWGMSVVWYGLVQGAAGELGFAAFRYRRWTPVQAAFSGALVGAGASVLDLATYTPGEWQLSWQVVYVLLQVASGAIIAGLGSYALTRALSNTGVLDPFPSGHARELV